LSASNKVEISNIMIDWAGPGVLALCSLGKIIKMWDLITDESFNLINPDNESLLSCFSFNSQKDMISACSTGGDFLLWKRRWTSTASERTASWELSARISVGLNMTHAHWGSNGSAAVTISDAGALTFFAEQILCHKLHGNTAVIQISSNKLILSKPPTHKKLVELGQKMRIKDIALSERHLAVSSGSLIEVFDFSPSKYLYIDIYRSANRGISWVD
jgi:hypothetical protein